MIADIDGEAALRAADELTGSPGRAVAVQADVCAEGAGEALITRCVDALGSLDILVNNAGIYPRVPMLELTPELFDRIYRINLRGLAFLSQAAARRMIEQGTGGTIVNISSIDAFRPSMVGLAAYDASKGGVPMFGKSPGAGAPRAPRERDRAGRHPDRRRLQGPSREVA